MTRLCALNCGWASKWQVKDLPYFKPSCALGLSGSVGSIATGTGSFPAEGGRTGARIFAEALDLVELLLGDETPG